MKFQTNNIYYLFNEGNNRSDIFLDANDYLTFLRLVRELIYPCSEILAWSLLPKSFHLILLTTTESCIPVKQGGLILEKLTNKTRKLLSSYARIFNQKHHRTGSLFRQKTKSENLSVSSNLLNDNKAVYNWLNYIHQTPLHAGLVNHSADWIYSSFQDYLGLRSGTLCNKELAKTYFETP